MNRRPPMPAPRRPARRNRGAFVAIELPAREREAWVIAAAACGLHLHDWVRAAAAAHIVLNGPEEARLMLPLKR